MSDISENVFLKRKFIIHNIKIHISMSKNSGYDELAIEKAKKIIGKSQFFKSLGKASFGIFKKSVDAREKNAVKLVYSVFFSYNDDNNPANRMKIELLSGICAKEKIVISSEEQFEIPRFMGITRPIVCGFGPCGMFAALILAKSGARPIVFERGANADERVTAVENFWKNGVLSENTNVQFGEGGAGTFSDGKLMTRINDPLCSYVLETFAKHGANPDILVNAKPHVGTDKLRAIVKNIRKEIISLGGEVHFCSEMTSLKTACNGKSVEIGINGGEAYYCTDALFIAIGHSARNSFKMLYDSGIRICAKPFSVGVRIEHLQQDIDNSLYGNFAGHPALPHGEYGLSARFNERAVYTFCMCPGGTVVASASENETVVTNGMSNSLRNGINANSAVAVSVSTDDFGDNPFAAIEFQANIERTAYKVAGANGSAPIQTVGGLLEKTNGVPNRVVPTYTGKTNVVKLNSIFPNFISETLKLGICNFETKIKGFSANDAVLTAPETRTSSPVKLPRGEDRRALGSRCIYTCGEGAGYAGGITSAAVDGIRSALAFLNQRF